MAAKKKPARYKRKTDRFKAKHPNVSRKEWSALKEYNRQEAKQKKNIKRGRDGATPIKRKIIKK